MRLVIQGAVYYLPTTRATWASTASGGVYTGTAPSGLVRVGGVKKWETTIEKDKADTTSLDDYDAQTGSVWESVVGAIIKSPFKMTLKQNDTDAGQIAIIGAFLQVGIVVPLLLLNGLKTATGAQGIWLDAEILKVGDQRELKNNVDYEVEFQHSGNSLIPPQWVNI